MKKMWESRPANRGSIVEFLLKNGLVIAGIYYGYNPEREEYKIKIANDIHSKSIFVMKSNIKVGKVLRWR